MLFLGHHLEHPWIPSHLYWQVGHAPGAGLTLLRT